MKLKFTLYCCMPILFYINAHANNDINLQLKDCQSIVEDSSRLTCYDNINQSKQQKTKSETQSYRDNQFPSLIADLDEPNVFVSYGDLDFLGNNFNAVLLGIGKKKKMNTLSFSDTNSIDFNIYGLIRSQFDVNQLDTRNNRGGALINTDFAVGGELVKSMSYWDWRFSYTHKSTHLGDEFLIDNPNYLEDRINLSYEVVRWTAHKQIKNWGFYAGLGYITRSEPSQIDKAMWQIGWQYQGDYWQGFKPIWAVDMKSWGAYDWKTNINIRAGIEISHFTDTPFQLMFEYQDGRSPYGQFYTENLTFSGITLMQTW